MTSSIGHMMIQDDTPGSLDLEVKSFLLAWAWALIKRPRFTLTRVHHRFGSAPFTFDHSSLGVRTTQASMKQPALQFRGIQ
jgi:hypothetical protein